MRTSTTNIAVQLTSWLASLLVSSIERHWKFVLTLTLNNLPSQQSFDSSMHNSQCNYHAELPEKGKLANIAVFYSDLVNLPLPE